MNPNIPNIPTDEFTEIINTCNQGRDVRNHEIKWMISSLAAHVRLLKNNQANANTENLIKEAVKS